MAALTEPKVISMGEIARRFCIAPMIDCTDKHFRYLARLASQHSLLFTEMITTGAILNGDQNFLLDYHPSESPLALQLGGSQVDELAQSCVIANHYDYSEINLNVGCPSDKVQNHMMGACLMAEPTLVRECLQAMAQHSQAPVTIKHRIGLDDEHDYDTLARFVETVSGEHCQTFYVHARNAYLQGLSPKQNREIPPLEYHKVYQLKQDFPHLEIIINGGITDLDACDSHLQKVDGVMLGRAAYHQTAILLDVDQRLFGAVAGRRMSEVIEDYISYMIQQHEQGVAWHHMARHLMGICHGLPGARNMRRHISENIRAPKPFGNTHDSAHVHVLYDAVNMVTLPA